MSPVKGLTDNEWILMQIIWDHQPCTLRKICDEARKKQVWTRHAVISFLKRMEAKGFISIEDAQPVKLYSSLVDRDSTVSREIDNVVERVCNGSPMLLVSNLVRQKVLSSDELQELINILNREKDGAKDE